jgi:hypothetical protein
MDRKPSAKSNIAKTRVLCYYETGLLNPRTLLLIKFSVESTILHKTVVVNFDSISKIY